MMSVARFYEPCRIFGSLQGERTYDNDGNDL